MKKVILISESKRFTTSSIKLIISLKEKESMFIVGGFTHSFTYSDLVKNFSNMYVEVVDGLIERDQETVDENKAFFLDYCQLANIQNRVFEENHILSTDNLITESRFADLLVVDNMLFDNNDNNLRSTLSLKQAIHHIECAVLILPQTLKAITKIIIAYNGKPDSMFALKQFCYLFPEFLDLPAEIVYLNDEDYNNIPQVNLLKEYVKQNFSSVSITKLEINPKAGFAGWVSSKENSLIIAGAYSRKEFLNSLPDSFIDPILELHCLPVFLSHP